ncbi:hypothetical protein CLOBOL_06851 [Enterocloster bolteae ATCC BAA-613]|uniref:Uncharacterized protein n=1 Tax=Enterocloster bolteae (strain ATCC BAA-613 / DSM 15670 / CCUG 46953 / JCM 12243 / WAL 16351) TaxID=411902 RepID=A8S486_ENTBW|nr:hypothetical protein CLOBOL_06851 [Enterocloster bolteae ATCC BAA-613]
MNLIGNIKNAPCPKNHAGIRFCRDLEKRVISTVNKTQYLG